MAAVGTGRTEMIEAQDTVLFVHGYQIELKCCRTDGAANTLGSWCVANSRAHHRTCCWTAASLELSDPGSAKA